MPAAKREVIYIDPEDDITSVIDKIKEGASKVVAVVPGKRLGALQSAVNLRLLQRAAQAVDKKLVLVSDDKNLTKMAAGIGIYMSKNLQTRPAVPKVEGAPDIAPETEEIPEEDIASIKKVAEEEAPSADQEAEVVENEIEENADKMAKESAEEEKQQKKIEKAKKDQESKIKAAEAAEAVKKAKDKKSKSKQPNINKFRKRVIIAASVLLFLVAFIIWAILQKPSATITIRSQTSQNQYKETWVIDPNVDTNAAQKTFKSKQYSGEENLSADFSATGEKDIGQKASGSITIINCNDAAVSIAAGTAFAAGGKNYVSNTGINIPGSNFFSSGQCKEDGKATVGVTAVQSGESFNQAAASYQIAGSPGNVSASGSAMSGGTTNIVRIVQQSDIDAAKQKVTSQANSDYKAKLLATVDPSYKAIDSSFKSDVPDPSSNVQAGQQADGGRVESKVTYSVQAYNISELETVLEESVNQQLADSNQKVYSSDKDQDPQLTLQGDTTTSGAGQYEVSKLFNVGPAINEEDIKERAKSKKSGEIIDELEQIKGVSRVDVKISPFWRQRVPSDTSKITVKLKVDE